MGRVFPHKISNSLYRESFLYLSLSLSSLTCDACAPAARSGASRQAGAEEGAAAAAAAAGATSNNKDVCESFDNIDDNGNTSELLLGCSSSFSSRRGRRAAHRQRPRGGQRDGREHGHRRREGEHEQRDNDVVICILPRRDRALRACRRLRFVAAHRGGAAGLGEFFVLHSD